MGTAACNRGGEYGSSPPLLPAMSCPPNGRAGGAAGDPPGLTTEVETGHKLPPDVPMPFPESVLNDRDAPDPAVEGAAIGSAIARAEQQSGLCIVSGFQTFCRKLLETNESKHKESKH